jgi:hypothetical protein
LPLTGFPKVPYGALWFGTLSPLHRTFLQEIQEVAAAM